MDLTEARESRTRPSSVIALGVAAVLTLILCGYVIHSVGADGATDRSPASEPVGARYTPPLSLAVLGDSYTAGSDMGGNGYSGWALIICYTLKCGYDNRFAVGGSGFVEPGPAKNTFPHREGDLIASKPDMVIVAGGINDQAATQTQFRAAVDGVLKRLKVGLPKAQVRVLSPWSPTAPNATLVRETADLRELAAHYKYPFVDVSRVFVGHANLIGSDHLHPTDAGHAYLQKVMQPIVRQMMRAAAKKS